MNKDVTLTHSANATTWTPADFEVPTEEGKTRFHDLDLPHALLRAIQDLGFEYASPIQAESLPLCLQGKDMVGKAQTGTGKTAAFLINLIDTFLREPRPNRKPGAPRAWCWRQPVNWSCKLPKTLRGCANTRT